MHFIIPIKWHKFKLIRTILDLKDAQKSDTKKQYFGWEYQRLFD